MLTFEPVSSVLAQRLARVACMQGSVMAGFFGRSLPEYEDCWLVDPIMWRRGDDRLDQAHSSASDVEACLASFVGLAPGLRSIVVEDESATHGDRISQKHFRVGGRVLRWANIEDGLLEAARILRPTPAGAPLFGYLLESRPEDFGLHRGDAGSAPQVASLLESVHAIVVPVKDSDAQIALCRPSMSSAFDDL